jgi:hypothetical protein
MHLRHIRPRSVDWYDAEFDDDARSVKGLSTEEKTRLLALGQEEPAREPPLLHGGTVQPFGSGRLIL